MLAQNARWVCSTIDNFFQLLAFYVVYLILHQLKMYFIVYENRIRKLRSACTFVQSIRIFPFPYMTSMNQEFDVFARACRMI